MGSESTDSEDNYGVKNNCLIVLALLLFIN